MLSSRTRQPFTALRRFLATESAGGIILICMSVLALLWANSPLHQSYRELMHTQIGPHDAPFWINDGLMTLFFLLVGLELRREMTQGELASPSRLATPAVAALGGMVVPAVIFSLFNYHDRAAMRGWAVPVATDIAFALAVLRLLGRRIPAGLLVFLTALAIIDDLGAILIIALFYSYKLHVLALAAAGVVVGILWGMTRIGVRRVGPYLVAGAALWIFVLNSGVHATLAGVALAFFIPSQSDEPGGSNPALRLEHWLERFVAYAVLPLFGLANAGLAFDTLPEQAFAQPLVLGTILALVLGKQLGVFGSVMLAKRAGIAELPAGVSTSQLYGSAILCGIGFTMSLFIGDLAFRDAALESEVKLAVFVASLASACLGLVVLLLATRRRQPI